MGNRFKKDSHHAVSQEGNPHEAWKITSGVDSEVLGDHCHDISEGKWQTDSKRLAAAVVRGRQGV